MKSDTISSYSSLPCKYIQTLNNLLRQARSNHNIIFFIPLMNQQGFIFSLGVKLKYN